MLGFEQINLCQYLSRFVLKSNLLHDVVLLHIFAGPVLEVEVAQIIVENIFSLEKILETRLLMLLLNMTFWVENVEENSHQK